MKILVYILFLLSGAFFVDASIEQISGHAKAIPPGRSLQLVEADRSRQPSEFQGIMAYQWIRASVIAGAGFFLLSVIRRADSLDPLAP